MTIRFACSELLTICEDGVLWSIDVLLKKRKDFCCLWNIHSNNCHIVNSSAETTTHCPRNCTPSGGLPFFITTDLWMILTHVQFSYDNNFLSWSLLLFRSLDYNYISFFTVYNVHQIKGTRLLINSLTSKYSIYLHGGPCTLSGGGGELRFALGSHTVHMFPIPSALEIRVGGSWYLLLYFVYYMLEIFINKIKNRNPRSQGSS